MDNLKLSYQKLTKQYTPRQIAKYKSKGNGPIPFIGQKRALRAMEFGLGNRIDGFNVYVSGERGTGKMTAIREYLAAKAIDEKSPKDWCYVNHFDDQYAPKYINLKQGQGIVLKKEIRKLLLDARIAISKTMSSKEYNAKEDKMDQDLFTREVDLMRPITEKANKNNFIIKQIGLEINAFPKKDDHALTDKEYLALSKSEQENIIRLRDEFKEELLVLVQNMEKMHRAYREEKEKLQQSVAKQSLNLFLDPLKRKYAEEQDVISFLDDIGDDLLENLKDFLKLSTDLTSLKQNMIMEKEGMIPQRFDVNVLVNNDGVQGAPIVIEQNPTYTNLFGKIEKDSENGKLTTNFTLIRSGALHKANGGYLIIPIADLLKHYFSWDSLKRALKTHEIRIEEPMDQLGFLSTRGLKPNPIPLDVQIILVGRPIYYNLLYQYDEEFRELFKVKADFDTTMEASDENIQDFIHFLKTNSKVQSLIPISRSGQARLLTYSHRLANDQTKISTRFREILDILEEANHYAIQEGAKKINSHLIQRSIEEKKIRSELIKEKIQEMIRRKTFLIDLRGSKIGQLNGISVASTGDIAFGRPNRITASVSLGKNEIIDIEREVNLGGPIHSKGVLILKGFLTEKFGQDKLLNLAAQLVFEQSYGEIEGDSASSAELYAILSGLGRVPLKQSIAVTGSVNQKGQIQPVGGINEKIEGYFEVCQQHGLTGDHGVIIPAANKQYLILKDEVVQAVRNKQFHIWAIDTIDEGIEILTGIKAGSAIANTDDGTIEFQEDTVFGIINKRLLGFNEILKRATQPPIDMVNLDTLTKYLEQNVIDEEVGVKNK